jgi:O-antigen/teichoic acid export membrane protein
MTVSFIKPKLSARQPEAVPVNTLYFETDHLLPDLNRRSIRGSVATLSGQGVKFLLQTLSTVVLARLLLPHDYGLIAMESAIIGLIGMCADLGLSRATVQRAQITHAQVSTLFWVNCALGVALALVVVALAPAIAWFYHQPRLVAITLVLSVSFIFGGLTAQHQALLVRQMHFNTVAVIGSVSMACGVVTAIVMAWQRFGYWALVASNVVASAVNCILVWTKCTWRPGAFKLGVGVRSMVRFGGHLTGCSFLSYLTRNFDNILIGHVLGSTPLGIYSKAYGLLMLPMGQINAPIGAVLIPGLSRLQQRPAEYRKLYFQALDTLSLVTVPLVVFSFFLARDVVLVILGPRWLPVAHVFQLLAPAALVSAISFAPFWLCISSGRTRIQLNFALVSAPVCVGAFLVGIRWGIEGVAAAFSTVFTGLYWWFVWYASKHSPVGFSEILRSFLRAALPAFLAGVITWVSRRALPLEIRPILALLFCAMVFAFSYVGLVLLSSKNKSLILTAVSILRRKVRFWPFVSSRAAE